MNPKQVEDGMMLRLKRMPETNFTVAFPVLLPAPRDMMPVASFYKNLSISRLPIDFWLNHIVGTKCMTCPYFLPISGNSQFFHLATFFNLFLICVQLNQSEAQLT